MSALLFLAHRIPYPPNRGDKIRSFHILKALCELGPVHLAAFADDAADAAHEAGLRAALGEGLASCRIEIRRRSKAASLAAGLIRRGSASMAAFANSAMRAHITSLLEGRGIGAVFAFSGQMGQYLPPMGAVRCVMDFVDVDSAKFDALADETPSPLSWIYRREARLLCAEEAAIAERADLSLFVTQAEAGLFRKRAPGAAQRVVVLENGVDLVHYDPAAVEPEVSPRGPLLLFTGQMDYQPNIMAVSAFAREVLPLVRRVERTARFAIAGRAPTHEVRALAALDGVEVVGEVPDMRPWLAAARVVVAPLTIARGVQNKVLEAMAMGRPVVASSSAFAGIDAVAGLELMVADGAEETASAVLTLLGDDALSERMGRAARARLCQRYSWQRQLAALPRMVAA